MINMALIRLLIKLYKEANVKQYLFEIVFYLALNGLIFNLFLVQKLIKKIREFDAINKKLKKKFDALDKILNTETHD